MRITRNILLKLFGNVQRSKVGLMPTKWEWEAKQNICWESTIISSTTKQENK
jgi:hypothetical protein